MLMKRSTKLMCLLIAFVWTTVIIGSSYAYFIDNVEVTGNVIAAGNLKAGLEYKDEDGVWHDASDVAIFDYPYWEPNYTDVQYIRVSNKGNLAFQYRLNVVPAGILTGHANLMDVIDVYYGEVTEGMVITKDNYKSLNKLGTLSDLMYDQDAMFGILLPNSTTANVSLPASAKDIADTGSVEAYIVLHMQEEAGNEYQGLSAGNGFNLQLSATQYMYEEDSFGNSYDEKSEYPELIAPTVLSVNIQPDANGLVPSAVAFNDPENGVSAIVPAGAKMAPGATKLTLVVEEKSTSEADVTVSKQDKLSAYNVKVEGLAADNTVPVIINMGKAMAEGMNLGNYDLYHVENGVTTQMTLVASAADLDAHNEFFYNPATGEVIVAMATFSEVAVVEDTENAWNGEFDYSWYINAVTTLAEGSTEADYVIANADQLAAFGAIVGGMAEGIEQDSFSGKTVKLLVDVNLGYGVEGVEYKTFYPIGYYNSTGSYEKTSGGSVTSNVSSFEGTFDGNGHTIRNFYQNTWEMFGDYNDGYSGTPNHYKDAMGLFGYVLNGTVKNLTVENFKSDGEFTPTGVIAAYAVNSTFANIAITNCNPRVYNTGNGGIVGIGGNTSDSEDAKLTFTNITIDNTNKITALWGSWDVACGGLVGMFRGAGHVYMTNCHVAAQIDVYNDVCGNYQYYWYRYSGMMVGTNKNMVEEGGYTVPETSKFHATGCTVHFGEWNDYYYCELVANSLASYTHDHQFSRLEKVNTLPESATGTKHYYVENGDGTITCRHFINGVLHNHRDEGTETVNGQIVDVEDKTCVYLPFNQLFTGYGWGVKHVPIYDDGTPNPFAGVTILDREVADSVQKFVAKENVITLEAGKAYTLGTLFAEADSAVSIADSSVTVGITNLDENGNVTAVFNGEASEWQNKIITFTGAGNINIIIQDYQFCIPAVLKVNVGTNEEITSSEKFALVFPNTDDYLYRVGNANTVALSSLFKVADGVTNDDIGTVEVTVETVNGASGTYTSNATWTNGTIQFSGTGVVKVTIKDDDTYCTPTELYLEVVNATNTTTAASATKNNVVLLNDCNFSTIEVSNGYTLFGNGFKMEAKNDVMYDTMRAGFVTLDNGTLDNVQIICPNFSYSIVYNSQIHSNDNTAKPSDSSNDARGNVRSAVMATGNSKIINSYVHGGRAAVYLRSGNLVIDGSTISGGAAANIHAVSAQSLTLRDVTLIQKPFKDTVHNTGNTLIGLSGLFECGEDGNSTPLILEGTLIQDAWVNESYKQYVSSEMTSVVTTALSKTDYLHDLDGDGTKESLNLGFTYIPQDAGGSTQAVVTDNRTNKDTVPYKSVDVGNILASAKVYSYKNTNGTSDDFRNVGDYTPTAQGPTPPTVSFTDTSADRVFETKFDANDNRWESTLAVNLDNGNYTFGFDNLLVQKHGENLTYTVKTADDTTVDTSKAISLTASGMTEYVLTVTDGDVEHTVYFILTASKTSIPEPEVADTTGGTPLLVVKSKNGDWTVGIPALEGIKVKYYTVTGEVILDLAKLTPTNTGKQNGTNNFWETTKDGYKLKVTCGVIHDTKGVYGMPVVVDNNGTKQMYFTISSTNGYVSTNTTARSVTLTYEFTDPNGKSLTFSKTWQVNYADYKEVAQYSYSDFVKGTMTDLLASSSGGGNCVTPDTLVTLADGTQVRVDSLTGNEKLLVWNMETGMLDEADIMFVDHDPEAEYEIVHLYFSDGTDVKVIYEHGFWDYDLNKYVYLDRYAEKYIGHTFAKNSGSELSKVKLTDVVIEKEVTTAWSPVTADHLCYFVNGMLSMPGGVGGLFNIFDVDPATMAYDMEALARDIETYGLFTYEELNAIVELPEEMFNAAGGAYLKVSIGKGNLTMDELIYMIERYKPHF